MAQVADDPYAARASGLATLASQADELRSSIIELQSAVQSELGDQAPHGVRVAYDSSGVVATVTIDETLRLNAEQLHDAFALAFASAPIPHEVLAALIADPARLAALRARGRVEPTAYSDDAGIVSLLVVQGRPVRLRLGKHALVRASYAEIATELVRLARVAALGEVNQ